MKGSKSQSRVSGSSLSQRVGKNEADPSSSILKMAVPCCPLPSLGIDQVGKFSGKPPMGQSSSTGCLFQGGDLCV